MDVNAHWVFKITAEVGCSQEGATNWVEFNIHEKSPIDKKVPGSTSS